MRVSSFAYVEFCKSTLRAIREGSKGRNLLFQVGHQFELNMLAMQKSNVWQQLLLLIELVCFVAKLLKFGFEIVARKGTCLRSYAGEYGKPNYQKSHPVR